MSATISPGKHAGTGSPTGIDPRSPQLAAALTSVVLIAVLLLDERSATYVDVVANTLGALAGGAAVALWRAFASHMTDRPSSM